MTSQRIEISPSISCPFDTQLHPRFFVPLSLYQLPLRHLSSLVAISRAVTTKAREQEETAQPTDLRVPAALDSAEKVKPARISRVRSTR